MSKCLTIICPPDALGYNSESADVEQFSAMGYGPDFDPPLNSNWQNLGCPVVAYSANSQKEADLSAVAQSTECAIAQWQTQGGGQIPSYVNRQTSANGYCPDGSVFTYGVIGGLFAALTQAQADAAALSYVQGQLLPLHIVCLSDLPNAALADQQFSAILTATGSAVGAAAGSNQWNVVSGILPPGLTLLGDYPQAGQATITGIPTTTGEYDFSIQIITPAGDYMEKAYSIQIQV